MTRNDKKIITVDQALSLIKSGDEIVSGLAAAESRVILSRLHEISDRVKGASVVTCLPMGQYDFFSKKEYGDAFLMEGWFYSGVMRKLHHNGNITFLPNHLHYGYLR